MPFISKDWRSPGDYWVKNGSGWERFKVLRFVGNGNESSEVDQDQQQQLQQQPHCRINLRQTREISGFNTLSEALQLLDFQNAVRDQRKFQYICVIIRLLISNPLLGAKSQRILVKLLFQICDQVRIGWRHDLLRIIINEMTRAQDNFWGGNAGTSHLWTENKVQLDQIQNLLATYKDEAPRIPIQDFPQDIIRLIILKLSDDKDLRNLAESDETFRAIIGENRVWRQLCLYHFNRDNIANTAVRLHEKQQESITNHSKRRPITPTSTEQPPTVTSAATVTEVVTTTTTTTADPAQTSETKPLSSTSCCPSGRVRRLRQRFLSGEFLTSSSDDEDDQDLIMDKENNGLQTEPVDSTQVAAEEQSSSSEEEQDGNQEEEEPSNEGPEWETLYRFLKRNYNLKEEYAEVLNYCKPCNVLFWPSFGHPCIVGTSVLEDDKDIQRNYSNFLIDVKPCDFVSFFST